MLVYSRGRARRHSLSVRNASTAAPYDKPIQASIAETHMPRLSAPSSSNGA